MLRKNGELVDTPGGQQTAGRAGRASLRTAGGGKLARELSEASRQAKEQVSVLKQLEQKRREALSARETAQREAARIVEVAQQEASL